MTASKPRSEQPDRTLGMSREALLARVRQALASRAASRRKESSVDFDVSAVRLCGKEEDLVDRFAGQAAAAGAVVHRTDQEQLGTFVQSLMVEKRWRRASLGVVNPDHREILQVAVNQAGSRIVDVRIGLKGLYDVDVGITDVDAAIAESGTIVISSGAERSRGIFLVPPIHLAVVGIRAIVADLVDYWCAWPPAGHGAATVLITGPSKTADIEGILITGVHGPKELHVVVVDESLSPITGQGCR